MSNPVKTLPRRTPPYHSTQVHPHKTRGQIDAMLDKYNIKKYQWTLDLDNNIIQLVMEIPMESEKHILLKVMPSLFLEKRRTYNKTVGKNEIVMEPNLAASMRMLYNWLKAKLEAVTFGLTSVEQEFLSQVVINRTGKTVGELVAPALSGQVEFEALPGVASATASPPIIEAEFKEN